MNSPDISGVKFNRLTAIRFHGWREFPCGGRQRVWEFKCDCGNPHLAILNLVKRGHTRSCGCLQRETQKIANLKHGHYKGRKPSPLMVVWQAMKDRCNDPKSNSYEYYGAKGIRIEWDSFEEFAKDMEQNWRPGLTIERNNSNGNYSKSNCRWATQAEQNRNYSRNRWIEFNGTRKILEDWATEVGIIPETIAYRLNHGWSVEEAITTEVKR